MQRRGAAGVLLVWMIAAAASAVAVAIVQLHSRTGVSVPDRLRHVVKDEVSVSADPMFAPGADLSVSAFAHKLHVVVLQSDKVVAEGFDSEPFNKGGVPNLHPHVSVRMTLPGTATERSGPLTVQADTSYTTSVQVGQEQGAFTRTKLFAPAGEINERHLLQIPLSPAESAAKLEADVQAAKIALSRARPWLFLILLAAALAQVAAIALRTSGGDGETENGVALLGVLVTSAVLVGALVQTYSPPEGDRSWPLPVFLGLILGSLPALVVGVAGLSLARWLVRRAP